LLFLVFRRSAKSSQFRQQEESWKVMNAEANVVLRTPNVRPEKDN
jgi:hypothetical protein